jgi:hypothetical protein
VPIRRYGRVFGTSRRARRAEIATVTVGLLATLAAKPGKQDELAAFVASALPLADGEPDTTAWFAIKLDGTTFGFFDVVPGH